MSRRSGSRRCSPASAAVLSLFAFFFTADLKFKEDGSGKVALVYPAAKVTTVDVEQRRFESTTTHATGLRIENGAARVRVAFSDVTRLAQAPEFQNTTVELTPGPDGTETFRATLRAALVGNVLSDRMATVRVTLPGEVVDSNALSTSGSTAMWWAPITSYFSGEGIEISATYRRSKAPSQEMAERVSESTTRE